jgi:ketosteroid isomerase-like protein
MLDADSIEMMWPAFSRRWRVPTIPRSSSREFIEAGEHVTVLGWAKVLALDTGMPFESEWVHVFTVRDGKVVRWRGFANTAARYGH